MYVAIYSYYENRSLPSCWLPMSSVCIVSQYTFVLEDNCIAETCDVLYRTTYLYFYLDSYNYTSCMFLSCVITEEATGISEETQAAILVWILQHRWHAREVRKRYITVGGTEWLSFYPMHSLKSIIKQLVYTV